MSVRFFGLYEWIKMWCKPQDTISILFLTRIVEDFQY